MTEDPKSKPDDLSEKWFDETLVRLVSAAKEQAEPDHASCAKYMELAFKRLQKPGMEKSDSRLALLSKVRADLAAEEGAKKVEKDDER